MDTATPENFQKIEQRQEIHGILQELLQLRESVYGYSVEDGHALSFRIQHVNVNDGLLSLLPLGNFEAHQRLLLAHELQLWSRHKNIRIAFTVERLGKLNNQSQLVSMPSVINRYQQRYSARIAPSYAEPLICRFVDHNNIPVSAQVVDICEGGIGIIESDGTNELKWDNGQYFNSCYLGLGNFGEVHVGLRLCHVERRLNAQGLLQVHAGARFVDPSPQLRQQISQYRQQIELTRQRHLWRQQPFSRGLNKA